jgi:hypothetical protein
MNDIVAIMRAADFAARKHTRQKQEAQPYLNHLIEVASLVADATDGRPDVVIAALLHDAVEDQDVTKRRNRRPLWADGSLSCRRTDRRTPARPHSKRHPRRRKNSVTNDLIDHPSDLRSIQSSSWLIACLDQHALGVCHFVGRFAP